MNKSNIIMNGILCCLIILGVLSILGGYKEGFHSSEFCAQNLITTPLLSPPYGDYKQTNNKCALSNNNYHTGRSLAAKSNMADYSQKTNNKKYWSTPCNGSIMLPEMCGGLYKQKKITNPGSILQPNDNGIRVNFYDSGTTSFI